MSIIDRLASSLNRRDELPNQQLAKQIAMEKDEDAIRELVDHLHSKSRDTQSDCIKVLYETGELDPRLIAPYLKQFLQLLDHKNNRLQWSAMMALNTITAENPGAIYAALPVILSAAEKGSVITKDQAVSILLKLCAVEQYAADAFALLVGQLRNSPTNQLPMYAENAIPVINDTNKKQFIDTLRARLSDIEKDTKRKRVEQVIKKYSSQ